MIESRSGSNATDSYRVDPRAWDEKIAESPAGHLLQTYGWGELKHRHGWQVQRISVGSGENVAAVQLLWRKTPLGSMAYVSRGPAMSLSRDDGLTRELFHTLHRECRARGAVYLKVEPNDTEAGVLASMGFHPSPQTVQPRVTQILDLEQDLETLMRRQAEKTRYNIRLAAKKGVIVRRGEKADVPGFARLMEETGSRNGFHARSAAYYRDAFDLLGDNAELLVAEHEGDLLSAMLLTLFNGEATYLFGGSSSHKRNLMASYLIQWEAIRRAQERGMKRYDFWAVPRALASHHGALNGTDGSASQLPPADSTEEGDLWSVYRFKRGFGGHILTYCGAYDYVYDQRRYWLWHQLLPHALTVMRKGKTTVTSTVKSLRK